MFTLPESEIIVDIKEYQRVLEPKTLEACLQHIMNILN